MGHVAPGQPQDLTRPLPLQLLLLAQYIEANPHREMCRDRATYAGRLHAINFNRLFGDYALRQYQWIDFGEEYLNQHEHQNVVKSASLQATQSFIVNGSHYNKHAPGVHHWQE